MCCCMRHSCDISRDKAEPRKVLSGCGYWFKKVRRELPVKLHAMRTGMGTVGPQTRLNTVWQSFRCVHNPCFNTEPALMRLADHSSDPLEYFPPICPMAHFPQVFLFLFALAALGMLLAGERAGNMDSRGMHCTPAPTLAAAAATPHTTSLATTPGGSPMSTIPTLFLQVLSWPPRSYSARYGSP